MRTKTISVLVLVALVLSVGLLMPGCKTDDAGSEEEKATRIGLTTSVPMRTLNAVYRSREAMISLAEGSAEDPAAAYNTMLASVEELNDFSRRIDTLASSFDDSDYLYFWDKLDDFGSFYQIDTGTLGAQQLRQLELGLRSFENRVHDLNRAYSDYMGMMGELITQINEAGSIAAIQQNIPLVNRITNKTVELDAEIKDFSNDLFAIARKLRSAQSGMHY